MKKFRNHYNTKPDAGEVNELPGKTIPEQSMSLREILKRYASGLPVTGQKVPVYEGEDLDAPDISRLDKIDREQLKNELREELSYLKGKINSAQAEEIARKKAAKLLADKPSAPVEKPADSDQSATTT